MKALVAAFLLTAASAAGAQPLTVKAGESWVFTVEDGEPAKARKVAATAKPAKGQLMVTVRSVFGTQMIMSNRSAVAYTFRAQLFVDGKPRGARTCTLPAKDQPILEQWTQKADAVRLSGFKPTADPGAC